MDGLPLSWNSEEFESCWKLSKRKWEKSLTRLIDTHQRPSHVRKVLVLEAMKCLRVILDKHVKSVLTTSGAIEIIALPLASQDPATILFTLEMLNDVCVIPFIGHE